MAQLEQWRAEGSNGPATPSPNATKKASRHAAAEKRRTRDLEKRFERAEKKLGRVEKKLRVANALLDLQKKRPPQLLAAAAFVLGGRYWTRTSDP